MIIKRQAHMLYVSRQSKTEYPKLSILLAVFLLYLTPFVSSLLAVPATAICLYRVIRYDARVYAVDYCITAPIIVLSRLYESVPLLLYLSLFAAIWYFFQRGFRAETSYVVLLVLMNYLFLRMQMDINSFVLCFGQMFTLCILLPEQDDVSAERACKAFCISLLVSSVYAWFFRNYNAVRILSGAESLAIWGTNIKRFKGLFADPNFYMTLLTVAVAVILKLRDSGRIGNKYFIFMLLSMSAFGILTYSKTFFLMLMILVGVYLIWQFWNRKVIRGLLMTAMAIVALWILLTMDNSPFEVVLTRFRGAKNISDFTTNRSDIYLQYLHEITSEPVIFLFGKGLAAKALTRDPHNLYLEITYYTGIVGLSLFAAFHIAMFHTVCRRTRYAAKQNLIAKYEVLGIVFILFFTLHGLFQPVLYAGLFLGYLSILLTKKEEQKE